MKIVVDGKAYPYGASKPTNKTIMAFEDAMGVRFATWAKRMKERFAEISRDIKAAKDTAPEGAEPDLDDLDLSLSMRDTTALVFLARRAAGEAMLEFRDVEFTELRFEPEEGDDLGEEGPPGADEVAPDRDADPTVGSTTTVGEPSGAISPPTV